MTEQPHNTQTDDTSQKGTGNVRNTNYIVGMDKPFFVALAIAISIMSAFYAFEAGRQTAQQVYWFQRIEGFIEQLSAQGVPVPKDILDHIKKEHDK